ncbi:hypothetical protein AB0E04_48995 [Streptomyces sp. NPDC048251]|uniref:hypothetical protein n=1 Tax=Streptomyces sp. NPDC048251 TaxID=3154501 RepID=UPI003439988B
MNPPTQPAREAVAPVTEATESPALEATGGDSQGRHPVAAVMTLMPLEPEKEPPFTYKVRLQANAMAGPNARLRARTQLTIAHWAGNVDAASRVCDKLVDNAFRHGRAFRDGRLPFRLTVHPETHELLIEVDDADPEFPDFPQAAELEGKTPTGLWWVDHYKGRLAYTKRTDDYGEVVGKTVQAVLPVNWDEAA